MLDLANTTLAGETFYLGEDTYWGQDCSATSQAFTYDPQSNIMASATRTGSVDIGTLTYQGTQPYNTNPVQALSGSLIVAGVAEQTLRDLGVLDTTVHKPYRGTVSWHDAKPAASGLVAILTYLGSKGYKLSYRGEATTISTIDFVGDENPGENIPGSVRAHWSEALKKAAQYGIVNSSLALAE